ncbi:hypothetical protein F5Y04DRAFT_285908 [Hypomontagnella monticulosa]|nr:hypothetical protein F5Y04DRAFT_285908 [Hypomontagnella monticulosa]
MSSPRFPQPPTPEEKELYYFGLAGQPKLVARTSSDPWVKPLRESFFEGRPQARKEYKTVGRHEIVYKWSTSLVEQIISLLEGRDWNFFFPIRFGIEDDPRGHQPVVLLIAVGENSLSWGDAVLIGLSCRNVLRAHGVTGVEVEFQEACRRDLSGPDELDSVLGTKDTFFRGSLTGVLSPLLPFPGCPIAYFKDRRGEGTLGLYVRLEGDDSIYGLTCRHVVAGDRATGDSYKFSPGSQPQYHIQGNQETFEECRYLVERRKGDNKQEIRELGGKKQRWDDYYYLDGEKQHLRPTAKELEYLERAQSYVAAYGEIIDILQGMEDKGSRKMGQLMFHSSMELSHRRKGYLKDWALIKLDQELFREAPKNSVFVGHINTRGLPSPYNYSNLGLHLEDGFLTLCGVMPEGSMQSQAIVGKVGTKTGCTLGMKNEIEAVVRRPGKGGKDMHAWQMIVIPPSSSSQFSSPGDSGSCVFNFKGQVVGILTSNASGNTLSYEGRRKYPGRDTLPSEVTKEDSVEPDMIVHGMDISFVDPIHWVFEDIETFTSKKVELI